MDKILTQRYEETRECEAHLRQDPLLYPFGCCSFVPSVPFLLSYQCPILLHLILIPFVLLGWGGEASLHLKERGFGRSGVPLLCVGLKLGLALLIDTE